MASQSDTPHLQLRQNPTSRISLYLEEQVLCGPGGSVSCHFLCVLAQDSPSSGILKKTD